MPLSPSYTLGLFFIFCVSLIWAAASVLVQFVYSDKFSFNSPFLLTYTGVSLFSCFLPLKWLTNRLQKAVIHSDPQSHQRQQSEGLSVMASPVPTEDFDDEDDDVRYESIQTPNASSHGGMLNEEDIRWGLVTERPTVLHWTTRDHFRAASKIAPVWFISNFAYNASLQHTSITSSTVLASTGSLFTFIFALIARDEHFTLYKFLGVCLGVSGSIMTGLHDIEKKDNGGSNDNGTNGPGSGNEKLLGDLLGLVSAAGYGGYALMVRILCPRNESLMSMQLFLGFVGLWNFVVLSPIAIYEGFFRDTGLTWFIAGCLIVKGLMDNALSDYLWARSVVLTSATVATVGLGLTIPLAFASDVVLGRPNVMDMASVLGALSVLSGFVLVNLGQQQENEEETLRSPSTTRPDHCPHEGIESESRFRDGRELSHMSFEYRDEPQSSVDQDSDSPS